MNDILLFLAILLGLALLVFICYRLFVAIILYRYVADNAKLFKKDGDQ